MNLFSLLIFRPMGWLLQLLYSFIQNYGLALIAFTVLIKLLILPLNIKSQKAMLKQQKLQPLMQEIQKKYAHDKEKQSQELMKLYKENGASPTAGCLPMLIQFPLIIGLYTVLRMPLSFMCGVNFNTPENINKVLELQKLVKGIPELAKNAGETFLNSNMKTLADNFQIEMSSFASSLADMGYTQFADWKVNFNFLGLDLSRYPSEFPLLSFIFGGESIPVETILSTLPLLIIPVLAGVTSWILAKMTQNKQQASAAQANGGQTEDTAAQMNKSMTLMMPIMSLVFSYTLPSGIGMYWIVSNVVQMIQQKVTAVIFKKKEDEIVVIDTIKKNGKNGKNR